MASAARRDDLGEDGECDLLRRDGADVEAGGRFHIVVRFGRDAHFGKG